MVEACSIVTADGATLEAERCTPPVGVSVRGGIVLCHPHPAHGGSMQSVVVSPLFEALPVAGFDTLRFNFRGVGRSTGSFDNGDGERLDADAVIGEHRGALARDLPLIVIGFSFGADITLSMGHDAIAAHCAIAPPFHFGAPDTLAHDPRPKQLVLAARDDFRDPQWVRDHTSDWTALAVDSITGANHFFVARTEQLIAAVTEFLDRVAPGPAASA